MQGQDLVVSCYYIDSGMNAFAISPAQVSSPTHSILFLLSFHQCFLYSKALFGSLAQVVLGTSN